MGHSQLGTRHFQSEVSHSNLRNEPLPVWNEAFPVENEPFPVRNEPFPAQSEAFPVENELFPAPIEAFQSRFSSVLAPWGLVSSAIDAR